MRFSRSKKGWNLLAVTWLVLSVFEGNGYGELLALDKASSVVSVVRARTRIAREMAISMISGIALLRNVGSPVKLD